MHFTTSNTSNYIFHKKITPYLLIQKIVVTRVTRSEMASSKVKIKYPLWLFVGYSLVTGYNQTFPSISTEQN